ncbi:MAG: DUF4258 domain-containing protein [Candidatus Nanohaloarchaea archaeon]|nr:DUF4258 domain-containing protein [Candidatus Nanohaloarchaea archaeon]
MKPTEIEYTAHAEERLRERFISKQDVETGIYNQKWVDAGGGRKKVIHSINGKEIKAVFKPNHNKVLVITVHWM